jgi:hypothetical protein
VSSTVAAVTLFVALAVFHTWPLASDPETWCHNLNSDTVLNEWTLAWVAHQIATDPVHLFDGNIFYPDRRTVAYSEHMLPQSLLVAPVLWGGGSPVLAYNLALLAGFVFTAWAVFHVVRTWTGNWPAAVAAGSLAAFNAYNLSKLAHLQALHVEFLPLALLVLDRLLRAPRLRHAWSLALWFTLQALTSGYWLVFSVVAMVAAFLVRPAEWIGRRFLRVVPLLLLSSVLAVIALVPFLVPYWLVRTEQGLVRPLEEVTRWSAIPTDYLATRSLLHFGWSEPFVRGDSLFPGFVGLALVVASLASRVAFVDVRARMCLAIAAVAFCLSFGTAVPFYAWLYEAVPLLQGIRGAVRFGQLALVASALLGGFGLAWLLSRIHPSRLRTLAGVAIIVVVNAEAWRGPLPFMRFQGIPPIFETLAETPSGAVIAYFPMYSGAEVHFNSRYMLASTVNWRRMVNGYSGFTPQSYRRHVRALERFPEPATIDYLRNLGVTYVAVDGRNMPAQVQMLPDVPRLRMWTTDGNLTIYQLQ